jgi:hypothetical protein
MLMSPLVVFTYDESDWSPQLLIQSMYRSGLVQYSPPPVFSPLNVDPLPEAKVVAVKVSLTPLTTAVTAQFTAVLVMALLVTLALIESPF